MSHRKSKTVPRDRRRMIRGFPNDLHELMMDTYTYPIGRERKGRNDLIGRNGRHLRLPYASVILD